MPYALISLPQYMFRGNCDEDCYFLTSPECTDCRECAYCGSMLYHNGSRQNIHFYHIMAEIKGGRTKVPACALCNQSKHDKPLRGWLRRITETRPSLFQKIVEYHLYKRNKISIAVRAVRKEFQGK